MCSRIHICHHPKAASVTMPAQTKLCRIVRGISAGTRRAETSDFGSLRTGAHRLSACPWDRCPVHHFGEKAVTLWRIILAAVTNSGRRPTVFPDEEACNADYLRASDRPSEICSRTDHPDLGSSRTARQRPWPHGDAFRQVAGEVLVPHLPESAIWTGRRRGLAGNADLAFARSR